MKQYYSGLYSEISGIGLLAMLVFGEQLPQVLQGVLWVSLVIFAGWAVWMEWRVYQHVQAQTASVHMAYSGRYALGIIIMVLTLALLHKLLPALALWPLILFGIAFSAVFVWLEVKVWRNRHT